MRFLKGALLAGALVAVAACAQAKPEVKREPTFDELGHIHGYLIRPSGEGLTGVVALRTAGGKLISLHDSTAWRKGRFDIDNLLPGRYTLTVESLGTNIELLDEPEPVAVEVRDDRVARPRLVAR